MTVPEVDARGSPARSAAESRTPSIAVVSPGRACREINSRSSPSSASVRKELSERGIRVNSVAPGPTRTRIAHDAFERFPDVIPPIVARTALGRLGDSDDVGKVIAALLSDECAWVTGENIEASGGFNL